MTVYFVVFQFRPPFADGLDHEPDGDSLDTVGLLELLGVYESAPGTLISISSIHFESFHKQL